MDSPPISINVGALLGSLGSKGVMDSKKMAKGNIMAVAAVSITTRLICADDSMGTGVRECGLFWVVAITIFECRGSAVSGEKMTLQFEL